MRHPDIDPGYRKRHITHLWERHKELARRLVIGERPKDIAQSMGFTDAALSNISNSPIFKNEVNRLREKVEDDTMDISKRIQGLTPSCIDTLESVLEDKDELVDIAPRLKVDVAKDLLDRAGYAPVKKSFVGAVHAQLTTDEINEMKNRINSSDVIEVSRGEK